MPTMQFCGWNAVEDRQRLPGLLHGVLFASPLHEGLDEVHTGQYVMGVTIDRAPKAARGLECPRRWRLPCGWEEHSDHPQRVVQARHTRMASHGTGEVLR